MAKRKKPDDRQTPQVYAAASLTNNDLMSSRYMVQSADVELVGRMIRNTVARAIDLNATVVASQPMRLYRPSSTSKVYGKRRVDRKTKAFLSGRGPNKPHKKAVSIASAADEMEEITDHPILDLLYAPDPSMTCGQWFYLIQSYIEATGWCAAWMGPDQIPKGMYVLAPHQTKIDFTIQDYIRGFMFGAETSKERFFPADECAYFRLRPHPQNPNRAASWVSSVIMPSDMEQAALQSEIARWNNGGLPGAIYKINATSQTEFDRAANEIDRQTRGVNKAGRNLIISNAEVIQPASKPHEMNYQAGLDTAEARIYRAAGIPEPLWKLNDANLASASAASPAYMNLTIWPRLSTLAEILTEYVVSRFDPTGTMFLAFDNPDNEDVEKERTGMIALANAGLVTANEARAALGIEQGDESLDAFRFNGVPIAMPAMNTAATVDGPDVADPAAAAGAETVQDTALNGAQVQALAELASQVALGQLPLGTARAIARAAFPAVSDQTLDSIFKPLATFTPEATDATTQTPAQRNEQEDSQPEASDEPTGSDGNGTDNDPEGDEDDASKSNHVHADGTGGNEHTGRGAGISGRGVQAVAKLTCTCDTCHTKEAELAKRPDGMNAAIEQMADDMARWYQATLIAGATESGLVVSADALAQLDQVLDTGLARMYQQGYTETFQLSPDADGAPPTFQINERARQYLMETKLELVRTIPETLKEQATRAIADGLGQGQTINEIRDKLAESGSVDAMAERVARTETARAYQYGDMQGAEEAGGFAGRTWLLAGGPCPLCSAISGMLEGKVVPFTEPFIRAGTTIATTDGAVTFARDVFVPSEAHPNCRCISINELAEEDDGN
jgi:hypothetical protein